MFVEVDLELRPKNFIYITWTCPDKIDQGQILLHKYRLMYILFTVCKDNKSFHYSIKENMYDRENE